MTRDRDGAEGGDANAAPVPQDRQARAEGIAQLKRVERILLKLINAVSDLGNKAAGEMSMSGDVEELRRDVGEKE
jgi:hypothetical protein